MGQFLTDETLNPVYKTSHNTSTSLPPKKQTIFDNVMDTGYCGFSVKW